MDPFSSTWKKAAHLLIMWAFLLIWCVIFVNLQNQLLLEEIEDLQRKEHELQQANAELLQKLADAKGIAEAIARAGPSVSQGQPNILARDPRGSSLTAPTVYPSHPNLRDPQTSQTSLHLGLFSESFPPSSSRRQLQESPVEQEGETSLRWDHPQY
jgi:MADS-box transcription factor